MDRRYRTVKLPSKMLEAVEQLVREHPECGYGSIADFVKDFIRHHYCWLKRPKKKQMKRLKRKYSKNFLRTCQRFLGAKKWKKSKW